MTVPLARMYYPVQLILMLLIASVKVLVLSQPFCNDSRLINDEPQPVCPGDDLQILCHISGSGSTIYYGDALSNQCPDNGNEITLFHNRFPNVSRGCGNAVGQGLAVDGNEYKSQLFVYITCNQNGTSVICQHEGQFGHRDICNFPFIIRQPSPPVNVRVIIISFDSITFSWNNTASMCSVTSYIINSSGCGTCPTTTNLTTATCFNVRFNSSEPCIFSVSASICESDAASTPFTATFRDLVSVPDFISVVLTYSQQSLLVSIKLQFQIKISLPIPPDANITAMSHNVSYTNSMSNELCRLNTIDPITECFNDICRDIFEVVTTPCLSADITVTLSSNVYGITKASLPLHIDGTNKFVMVTYNPVMKTLTCTFLNIEDMSEKACIVIYGPCGMNATKTDQGILQSNVVEVQLLLSDLDRNLINRYCYAVRASNGTFSVYVMGNFSNNDTNAGINGFGIAGITIACFLIVIIIVIIIATIIMILVCIRNKGKTFYPTVLEDSTTELKSVETPVEPQEALLEPVSEGSFRLYKVEKPTGLLKFFKKRVPGLKFIRGIVFYEFTNSTEDIDKNCRLILMDKNTKKLFSGQRAQEFAFSASIKNQISNDRFEINRPNNEQFRVFVQDYGPGSRFLDKDSYLLVNIECEPSNNLPRSLDLTEVPLANFRRLEVTEDSQLHSFITKKNNLKYWRGCAFYEFSHESEDISDDKKVLLFDVKTNKLFTGEGAKSLVGVPGDGIRNLLQDSSEWRVFVQSRCTGNRHLDRNTLLWYQNERPKDDHAWSHNQQNKRHSVDNCLVADSSGDFKVIPVHESCSLRKFIDEHEETNGYERKCAYFEFCHDEEDITDKDIILMDTKGELHLGGGAIEKIGGHVSTIGVKKPNLPDFPRVFIQCNGPGYSVHIEAGSSIIYKDPKIGNLEPVDFNEYDKFEVTTTSELRRFVEDKVGEFKRGAAFYQFTCDYEDISKDKKVLLMSKDNNAMYTGAAACHKIGAPGKGIRRPPDNFQYTVFVQNKSRGSRCLLEGTILLYKKNFEDDNEGTVLK